MRKICLIVSVLVILLGIFGCGQKKDIYEAGNFLPFIVPDADIEKVSDKRIYRGDSLWEYIDGGAELYHDYNFVEVATADYMAGEDEFVVDIYRFDTPLDAYGLYTNFRPPSPDTVNLGVEGYKSPSSINFVKGRYLVRLTAFDDSPHIDSALELTARAIDSTVPGTTQRSEMFKKFYFVDKIKYTDKYFTKSYLGRKYLTDFYTQDYLVDSDTVTMFLSEDSGEVKLNEWVADLKNDTSFFETPRGILTVNGRMFVYNDPYYRKVIVIYDSDLIFGALNFKKEYKDILAEWVTSMPGFNTDSTMARVKRMTDSLDN
jgi:hypothetical protein